jgi:hypothetical protein
MHVSLCGGRVSTLDTKIQHAEALAHPATKGIGAKDVSADPTPSEMSIPVVRSNAWLESHEWLVLCSLDDLSLRLTFFAAWTGASGVDTIQVRGFQAGRCQTFGQPILVGEWNGQAY